MTSLQDQLFTEVLAARERIYHACKATPLQQISIPELDAQIFIKREDLSVINSYKWRGAYNCTSVLKEKGVQTVVAASAGNHAQGVALAARILNIQAKIFMPLTTPLMKQRAVKTHGGEHVEVILTGDTYDQVSMEAHSYCEKNKFAYVHAFNDIHTIAGQATIADELVLSGNGPFDYVFLQIGGGGLAAGVSSWLKKYYPATTIIGVEGAGQASMKASFAAGKPTALPEVDSFCDGTAVKRPGNLTFDLCKESLDNILTVSNEEVSAATQQLWEACRAIPEPSGAMGLAGLLKFARANPEKIRGRKLLAVICGANMDFSKLGIISNQAAIGTNKRHYLRLHMKEKSGSLSALLEKHFSDVNTSEFQYGKMDKKEGWPVIAFEASAERMDKLFEQLRKQKIPFEDVTGDADIRYRIINYKTELMKDPLFFHVHFPERRGALREFMQKIAGTSNLCYFNYAYSGETIGRAIMGFEFENDDNREQFMALIKNSIVTCRPLDDEVVARILGQNSGGSQ